MTTTYDNPTTDRVTTRFEDSIAEAKIAYQHAHRECGPDCNITGDECPPFDPEDFGIDPESCPDCQTGDPEFGNYCDECVRYAKAESWARQTSGVTW